MPETLLESEWLDTLIAMSPGCQRAQKEWRTTHKRAKLPPGLRKGV